MHSPHTHMFAMNGELSMSHAIDRCHACSHCGGFGRAGLIAACRSGTFRSDPLPLGSKWRAKYQCATRHPRETRGSRASAGALGVLESRFRGTTDNLLVFNKFFRVSFLG